MVNTIQLAKEAIRLIQYGVTVIPLRGKAPRATGWNDLRGTTREQIEEWVGAGLFENLGMVTGEASNNMCVIDFDGLEGYRLFKAKFPELADTKTVATGSGNGVHVYFKCDLLPDSLSLMNIEIPKKNEDGEILDEMQNINIEFRANDRSVVLPPSVHPDTGNPYTYLIDSKTMQVTDLSAVIAWAKSMKPVSTDEWSAPKTTYSSGSGVNPKLLKGVEDYFLSRPHKVNGEWILCSCPNPLAHKHGDRNYSFGYKPAWGFGYCWVCGDMKLKRLLPLIGLKSRDFGGFFEGTDTAKPQEQLDRMPTTALAQPPVPPASTPAPLTKGIRVVKRSSRLAHYMNRITDYDMPIEHPPVVFPLRALHQLGGMARIIKPGKLVGIVGMSGSGKTSLLETMVDGFLDDHASCLVWSPEWSPDEFIERAAQRYGGPSASDVYLHEKFISDLQRGEKSVHGRELPLVQQQAAAAAVRKLSTWESEVGYLDNQFLTVGEMKDSMTDTLATLDFKPQVLVIDYLQLFHALEPNHNITMYSMIMQIKALCNQHNMIGVDATQVTKADTKAKVKKNEMLDAGSARYVNDDAFNLFITINPDYDSFGNKLGSAVLNVAKNSMGRPGKVRVPVEWERLAFGQEPHAYQGKLEPDDEEDKEDEKDE